METRPPLVSTLPVSKPTGSRSSFRKRCISSAWPTNTCLHCWNCCHQFAHVPAFLPVSRDYETGVFHLSGIFCSWNCAKAYRYSNPHFCHKDSASFLSVFAFLTSHRPRYCPDPMKKSHSYDCRCLDYAHKVKFPPRKENLKMFGGNMTIEEYRLGFMIIDEIDWVTRCFTSTDHPQNQIRITAHLRDYVYDFLPAEIAQNTRDGDDMIEETKQEAPLEPVVMIDGIDESFFY